MRYQIILAPEAVRDLKRLPANVRAAVKDAIGTHLRHEPTKLSRSRIKRLRSMAQPQYRLRVDEVRVFYDVRNKRVEILAIVNKADAADWLTTEGKRP